MILGNEFIEGSEFNLLHVIGEGAYSQVFLAEWHGVKVAVKKSKFRPAAMIFGYETVMNF